MVFNSAPQISIEESKIEFGTLRMSADYSCYIHMYSEQVDEATEELTLQDYSGRIWGSDPDPIELPVPLHGMITIVASAPSGVDITSIAAGTFDSAAGEDELAYFDSFGTTSSRMAVCELNRNAAIHISVRKRS